MKTQIRINTTLKFDEAWEGDIIDMVEGCSSAHVLNRLIEAALRVACSTDDGVRRLKAALNGYPVDEYREAFFEKKKKEQKQEALNYASSLTMLSMSYGQYKKSLDYRLAKVEAELAKLYVLADSGNLLGMKSRANLLNVESLLISREAMREQGIIWDGICRPEVSKEEEDRFKQNLPQLAEEVMEYLVNYYGEHLSELRCLFGNEAAPSVTNDQLTFLIGQLLKEKVENGTEAVKEAQPLKNEQKPIENPSITEPEEVTPDVDAVMGMFGAMFD